MRIACIPQKERASSFLEPCIYVYCQMSSPGIKGKGGSFGVLEADAEVIIQLKPKEEKVVFNISSIRHAAIF